MLAAPVGAIRVQLVDRDEGAVGGGRGRFDRFAAAREAVDDGDDGDGLEALLPDLLDRLHGRAAAGDRVLDHEAALSLPDRALDPALQAVLLALAADEEADQAGARRYGEGGATRRDRRRRRAADRARAGLDRRRRDQLTSGAKARRPQQRPPRVDVVLRRRPTGQRHLPKDQRVLAQLGDQRALGGVEVRHGAPRHTRSEDENAFAVLDPLEYLRLVGDEGAQAAVAGRVVGHRLVTVDGVAAVEVPGVVHAEVVVAGFGAVEAVVAGHRRGRRGPRRGRVDRVGLAALGEDEHLLAERRLDVAAGAGVAHTVAAATGEDALDQALAGPHAAAHLVDFAVGEHAARRPRLEAAPLVGDVAHPAQAAVEGGDVVPALAAVKGLDLPRPRHRPVRLLRRRRGGDGGKRQQGGEDRDEREVEAAIHRPAHSYRWPGRPLLPDQRDRVVQHVQDDSGHDRAGLLVEQAEDDAEGDQRRRRRRS